MPEKVKVRSNPSGRVSVMRAWSGSGRSPLLTKDENFKADPESSPRKGSSHASKAESLRVSNSGLRPGWGVAPSERHWRGVMTGKILDVGQALEHLYPLPEQSCFLTMTLPGDTDEANEALASWSGWIVNRILQHIRDTLPEADYFYKWEFQGRGALHLHLCVAAKEPYAIVPLVDQWKSLCWSLLKQVCEKSGWNLFARERKGDVAFHEYQADAQIVEKSVSRYLAKYCSKPDKKVNSFGRRTLRKAYPARFSGNSRRLSRWVRDNTFEWQFLITDRRRRVIFEEIRNELQTYCKFVCAYRHKWGTGDTEIFRSEAEDRLSIITEIGRLCGSHSEGEDAEVLGILLGLSSA